MCSIWEEIFSFNAQPKNWWNAPQAVMNVQRKGPSVPPTTTFLMATQPLFTIAPRATHAATTLSPMVVGSLAGLVKLNKSKELNAQAIASVWRRMNYVRSG